MTMFSSQSSLDLSCQMPRPSWNRVPPPEKEFIKWYHAQDELSEWVLDNCRDLTILDSAIQDTKELLERLQTHRQSLRQVLCMKSASMPANRASPEILKMIFSYGHSTCRNKLNFALKVASITRKWREVAINTPHIWSTINIQLDRDIVWPALEMQLRLSQKAPLQITITTPPEDTSQEMSQIAKLAPLLSAARTRWQSLHVNVRWHMSLQMLLHADTRDDVPIALQSVEMHASDLKWRLANEDLQWYRFSTLRNLHLSGSACSYSEQVLGEPEVSAIEELVLKNPSCDDALGLHTDFNHFLTHLSNLSQLKKLTLVCTGQSIDSEYLTRLQSTPQFLLKELTELTFEGIRESVICYFFASVRAPALKHVSFIDIHNTTTYLERVFSSMNNNEYFPLLCSLSMKGVPPPGRATDILAHMDFCTSLELGCQDATGDLLLHLHEPYDPASKWYCPRLHTLVVREIESGEQIRCIVESRYDAVTDMEDEPTPPPVSAIRKLHIDTPAFLTKSDWDKMVAHFSWTWID